MAQYGGSIAVSLPEDRIGATPVQALSKAEKGCADYRLPRHI